MITKIVSGGQTGVDRAALDAAIELNIDHGGWCPQGRLAEDAKPIDMKYCLTETESSEYNVRTKLNIRDSDGTLIFVDNLSTAITGGTSLTIEELKEKNKSYKIIDLSAKPNINKITHWNKKNNIQV